MHTELSDARVTTGLLDVIGDKSVNVLVSVLLVITDDVMLVVLAADVKLYAERKERKEFIISISANNSLFKLSITIILDRLRFKK